MAYLHEKTSSASDGNSAIRSSLSFLTEVIGCQEGITSSTDPERMTLMKYPMAKGTILFISMCAA